ncbi:MAG TPA: ABC transporter ATP-binding protein [Thermoplasmata archaeon]|jgi:branched-chain amino acid transport system ATP-binding protein|nr:ABC transporter ATP-binding protein [Thermoplasmata archaeon]
MLRLEGVDAGYEGTQVLRDLTLEAKRGTTTVLIGPNGAGKSTTLKVVNGLLPSTRGEVLFEGKPITRLPAHERTALGIASCPEGRRLFPLMTTEGNLRLGAYPARARADADATLREVYELFPRLRDRAPVKAGRLSGGEQQMVGIGRALMSKPTILALDEPSLGLAPKLISEIFEKINQLREGGLTVLMVEQNAYAALRIADFAYVLGSGRILRSGRPDELMDLEELRKAYFAIG